MMYVGILIVIAVVVYLYKKSKKQNKTIAPTKPTESTKPINPPSVKIIETPKLKNGETVTVVKDGMEIKGKVKIMSAGLQVYDEYGNLKLDLTKRLPKVCGTMELKDAGEFHIPDRYVNNKLWYYIVSAPVSEDPQHLSLIRISDDGKSIIWREIFGKATILWGVY